MKKIFKKIFTVIVIIILLMQFYQPALNKNLQHVGNLDFTKVYHVPKDVALILQTSCYDCHSNHTNYPFYAYIQPLRFFMDSHIKEGKENLNFSEFGNYSKRKQNNKLDRIIKQIKENEMPLASYTLMHNNAILNASKKEVVINWINTLNNEE